MMNNAGGAWDNSKKLCEKLGLKKSKIEKERLQQKACVVGDTVGDPFKDTSGPALNILIKLMSVISLVIAPALKAWQFQNMSIVEWEWRSCITGASILVALIVCVVLIQRNIDAGYGKKRVEVEASIAAMKAKDKAAADAIAQTKANNPEVFKALKAVVSRAEADGMIEPSEVQSLLTAVQTKPVAVVKPAPSGITPMEISVTAK